MLLPAPARLLDLVLPAPCPGCGAGVRAPAACPACRAALVRDGPLRRPLPVGSAQQVVASAVYAGAVRELLVARKERGARGLDAPLGAALAVAVADALARVVRPPSSARVVLVPVPSRPAALRRRGEDTVARLAAAAARACGPRRGVETVRLLQHRRRVADSAGLDAGARFRNLDGAMAAGRRARHLRGAVVVVVDDLSTTGSTLAEACRALARAGVPAAAAAVVALVPPPGRPD